MKVLFCGLFPVAKMHFIAECNIIEKHLRENDEVFLLSCQASLNACDANPEKLYTHCIKCMEFRDNCIQALTKSIKTLPIIESSVATEAQKILFPIFETIAEIEKFEHSGIQLGKNVISTLVSITGTTGNTAFKDKVDIRKNTISHKYLINSVIKDYYQVYQTAIKYLESYDFKLVYIFNGRFATTRAWIEACKKKKVKYKTHERIFFKDHIYQFENGSIHDLKTFSNQALAFWKENKSSFIIREKAEQYYYKSKKGIAYGGKEFTSNQNPNHDIPKWDDNKTNIAIFSSTETEFAGLKDYFVDALFGNQKEGYISIAKHTQARNPSVHFYLRVHPNSILDKTKWWLEDDINQQSNITIIHPENPLSSYKLMESCEKTVVFMSTMGVEATVSGKPAIAVSKTLYSGLDAVYEPNSIKECVDLIISKNLVCKNIEGALTYSAFLVSGGQKLEYSRHEDNEIYYLNNINISESFFCRVAYKFWKKIISRIDFTKTVNQIYQSLIWFTYKKLLQQQKSLEE